MKGAAVTELRRVGDDGGGVGGGRGGGRHVVVTAMVAVVVVFFFFVFTIKDILILNCKYGEEKTVMTP